MERTAKRGGIIRLSNFNRDTYSFAIFNGVIKLKHVIYLTIRDAIFQVYYLSRRKSWFSNLYPRLRYLSAVMAENGG